MPRVLLTFALLSLVVIGVSRVASVSWTTSKCSRISCHLLSSLHYMINIICFHCHRLNAGPIPGMCHRREFSFRQRVVGHPAYVSSLALFSDSNTYLRAHLFVLKSFVKIWSWSILVSLSFADGRSMWHVQSSGCYPWNPPKQQSTPNTPSISHHDVYFPKNPVISSTPYMVGRTALDVMGMVSGCHCLLTLKTLNYTLIFN